MLNLKNNTKETIHKIETDPQTQKKLNKEEREETGINLEDGTNRYKLLYVKHTTTRIYCVAQGTVFNIMQ